MKSFFNCSPCVSYLMEENSATMQALVIAHAAYGHNSFFKSNELFRQWTDAKSIVDYLIYARDYVSECEHKYGSDEVEKMLDSCHALKYYGIDKYKRPNPLTKDAQAKIKQEKALQEQSNVNALWDNLIPKAEKEKEEDQLEEQENILYFLEKNAPNLKEWQREIIRITRKIAQHFYPQYQTQVMNEGWASTCHNFIMTRLMEKGQITEGSYLEYLHSHTGVVNQKMMSRNWNPYFLGFNMFAEIKRICQEPTKEDAEYFPDLVGTDWLQAWHFAVKNFRDESFITQYLSPKMVREKRMFLLDDDSDARQYKIERIHNDRGFKDIRSALSDQKKIGTIFPEIKIVGIDDAGDRTMYVDHVSYDGIKLEQEKAEETLLHLRRLWGFPIILNSVDSKTLDVITAFYSEELSEE